MKKQKFPTEKIGPRRSNPRSAIFGKLLQSSKKADLTISGQFSPLEIFVFSSYTRCSPTNQGTSDILSLVLINDFYKPRTKRSKKTMLFRPSLHSALTQKTCVIRITQVLCCILPVLFLQSTKHINISSPSICTIFHMIQWTISVVPTEIQNCNLALSLLRGNSVIRRFMVYNFHRFSSILNKA